MTRYSFTPGVRVVLALVGLGWAWAALRSSAAWWCTPEGLTRAEVWRLLSYPFAGGWSVNGAVALLAFLLVAPHVELGLGTRRFYRLFWGAVVISGAAAWLQSLWGWSSALAGLGTVAVAAWTAFCLLYWRERMRFGPFPVSGPALLAGLGLALAFRPRVEWLPAVSAVLLAYLMVRRNWLMKAHLFGERAPQRSRLGEDFRGEKVTPMPLRRPAASVAAGDAGFEAVMAKLQSEGMAGLTTEERELLERHSRRPRGEERV